MNELTTALIILAARYGMPAVVRFVGDIMTTTGDPSAEEWAQLSQRLNKSFEELVEEGKGTKV